MSDSEKEIEALRSKIKELQELGEYSEEELERASETIVDLRYWLRQSYRLILFAKRIDQEEFNSLLGRYKQALLDFGIVDELDEKWESTGEGQGNC